MAFSGGSVYANKRLLLSGLPCTTIKVPSLHKNIEFGVYSVNHMQNFWCLATLDGFLPSIAITHMSSAAIRASSVIRRTMFTSSGVLKPYCLAPAYSFFVYEGEQPT